MRFLDNFVRLYRLLPDGSLWGVLPSAVYIAMRCLGVLSDFSLNLFARYFVTMRTISAEKEHFLCTILQFYLHIQNICCTFAAKFGNQYAKHLTAIRKCTCIHLCFTDGATSAYIFYSFRQ